MKPNIFHKKTYIISYHIIILAAGASSRLGSPKQLLDYNNASLLQHAIDEALKTTAEVVFVVLGANFNEIKETFDGANMSRRVIFVLNNVWNEGIASSIRAGVMESQEFNPLVEGIILMVCDQPRVTSSLLNKLIETHEDTGRPIVASQYKDAVGTPVYFNSGYFNELLKLTGDTGAKKIIMSYGSDVSLVHFSGGEIDIDTKEDLPYLTHPSQEN